jgi:hypothetical protein
MVRSGWPPADPPGFTVMHRRARGMRTARGLTPSLAERPLEDGLRTRRTVVVRRRGIQVGIHRVALDKWREPGFRLRRAVGLPSSDSLHG